MSELPPGFVLDQPQQAALPPGFVLDGAPAVSAAPEAPKPAFATPHAALDAMTGRAPPVDTPQPVSVDNVVANVLRGVRKGAANIAGLPVDLVNAGLGVVGLPVSSTPFGGSRSVDTALGLGIVPDPRADNMPARYARRIGEEIGAGLPLGAGALAAGGRLGVEGAKRLPGVVGSVVARAADKPAQFIATEAAASTAAGIGGQAAKDAAERAGAGPGGAALADLFGSFAGVGTLNGVNALAPKALRAYQALRGSPSFDSPAVRAAVTDDLLARAGYQSDRAPVNAQPLIQQIERGNRPGALIPGYQETLADRTQNPGLAAAERAIAGKNAGAFLQRQAENNQAVDNTMRRLAPAEQSTAPLRIAVEDKLATLRNNYDNAVAQLPVAGTADARGSNIRAALTDVERRTHNIVSNMFKAIPDEKLNAAELVDAFKTIKKDESRFLADALPSRERGILQTLTKKVEVDPTTGAEKVTFDKPVSTFELKGLRTKLAQIVRANRVGNDSDLIKARIAERHIEALDDYLGKSSNYADQYAQARSAYRDYKDRFHRSQTGIGQTMAEKNGMPMANDAAVPGKFVQPDAGRTSDFRALMKEAGGDPRVQEAVQQQLVDEVQRKGLLDKPKQLGDYLAQRGVVLDQFPDLRAKLEGIGAAKTALPDNTDVVSKFARYGDEKGATAIKTVLADPRPAEAMDRLVKFAGETPAAIESAKRGVWDVMKERAQASGATTQGVGDVQPWRGNSMAKFLRENDAVMKRLYADNPEHLANIKKVANELRGTNVAGRARATNGSDTMQQQANSGAYGNIVTPATLQSRYYQMKAGRISPQFLGISLASVIGRKKLEIAQFKQFDKLMQKAFTEPDFAALLLKENNPANRALLKDKGRLWLGNEASKLLDLSVGGPDEKR